MSQCHKYRGLDDDLFCPSVKDRDSISKRILVTYKGNETLL